MPQITDFASTIGVPVSQLVKISESAAVDPDSKLFKELKTQLGLKLAAVRVSRQKDKRTKTRVYIQHAVPIDRRYGLVSLFPQFDIHFSGYDKRGGPVARAMSVLIMEYMLSMLPVKRGTVVTFGSSFKTMVMRKRSWIHCCYSGHVAPVQVQLLRDDMAIDAMYHSMPKAKGSGLVQEYIAGKTQVHCTRASVCKVHATAGVADFSRVDTNFRQVAYFMRAHEMRFLMFSVVGCKAMELKQEGSFPQLDAYVFPSDDGAYINVSYKNDSENDMSYLYTNYLELIARTTVVIDGVTYHKEFVNAINGRLVYKVTALDKSFTEPPVPYKSWLEPEYKNKYMLYCPVLRDGGCVDVPEDWGMKFFSVDRDIIDDVADHGMRSETPADMDFSIKRRLHSKLSNFLLGGQVVQGPANISAEEYRMIAFIIYTQLFMRKFKDGTAMRTLAPHIRQLASMAGRSNLEITRQYVGMLAGSIFRAAGVVSSKLAAVYRDAIGTADVPMPAFSICPGYVEYSQDGGSNPFFSGWANGDDDPFHGFSSQLPSAVVTGLGDFSVNPPSVVTTAVTSVDPVMLATGECYLTDKGRMDYASERAVVDIALGWFTSVKKFLPGTKPQLEVRDVQPVSSVVLSVPSEQKQKFSSRRPEVTTLATSVADQYGVVKRLRNTPYMDDTVFTPGVPELFDGPVADNPIESLRDAIMKLFPGSMNVNTERFESDMNYSPWSKCVAVLRMKLDLSKMEALKPESFYLPVLSGHVRPNVHDTFDTTFHAVAKRNADAPKNADTLHTEFLVGKSIDAMCKVFYRHDAKRWLEMQPPIGPTYEAVTEWASVQPDAKLNKLSVDENEFAFFNLLKGASRNQLMVKGKLKPAMEADYMTALKHPQTLQYDPSGKMVPVFSPIIAEKVAREQSVLKPNVLILQGKSIEDMVKFLNGFDWRPNDKGIRRYLEGDYAQYDKSQGTACAESYLHKCEMFGVMPVLTQFLREHSYIRTVAAVKSGIKIWLSTQNPSGAPYTLDRNNDVNMVVISEFLLKIIDMIEFIIMMGDDFIVAVRGEPNITDWSAEIARKYNLSIKLQLQEHGYICSMDIVHLPDGHTLLTPDIVKRMLLMMDMSIKTIDNLKEKYESFVDIARYVGDPRVAQYLAAALPRRYAGYLPTMDQDIVVQTCRALNALKQSFDNFSKLVNKEKTVRFY